MKNLLRAPARLRTRLFGLACQLHWRVFGVPEGSILIEVDDTVGVDCNVDCEAIGGPYHCMCIVQEDPQDPAEKAEPYAFDQHHDALD